MGNPQGKETSQCEEILHIQDDPNNNGIKECRKMFAPRQCHICDERICYCAYIDQTEKDRRYECSQCVNEGQRKTLRNILKNELNHSMEVIGIIIEFAVGLIANCCNIQCNEEISFQNNFLFFKQIDIDHNNICHYEVEKTAALKTVYIGCIGKEIRIFCESCTKKTTNCQKNGCKHKHVYFDNDINICSHHPSCIVCKGIFIFELAKCIDCHQSVCDNNDCSIYEIKNGRKCKFCYETDEKTRLTNVVENVLHNILDINSINIIINFGIGCIAECCKPCCDEEIVFQNKMDFINKTGDKKGRIYYYKTNKFNKLKSIRTPYIDGKLRIFCQLCSYDRIECKYLYCQNEDVYFEWKGICSNHYCPQCIICRQKFKYSTYLAECTDCNQFVCPKIKCGLEIKSGITLCRLCLEKEKKMLIIDALTAVIGDVLYEMIIKNICEYAFDLVMVCCNAHCHREIDFLSYPNHSGWYSYNINQLQTGTKAIKLDANSENFKFRVQQTDIIHNIRGEYLRIFCSKCTANNISKCEAVHCEHKDVNNLCFSHSYYCSQCKQRRQDEVREYEYCMEPCCAHCIWQRQQLTKFNEIQLKNVCKLYNLSTEGNKINLMDKMLDCLNDKVVYDDIQIEIERKCLKKVSKKQLKNICKSKGLPTSGNKQGLIEIILFHNNIMDKMEQSTT